MGFRAKYTLLQDLIEVSADCVSNLQLQSSPLHLRIDDLKDLVVGLAGYFD